MCTFGGIVPRPKDGAENEDAFMEPVSIELTKCFIILWANDYFFSSISSKNMVTQQKGIQFKRKTATY